MSEAAQGWLLAIHTTTPTLGLALQPLSANLAGRVQSWVLAREMAAQFHPLLGGFLPPQQWSDLVGIGVAVGPGSFTGARLGVTVARTLGQGLQLPVYGISSLAALAYASGTTDPVPLLAVQLDAQRGDWYGAIYRFEQATEQLAVVVPEQLWTPSAWQLQLQRLQQQPTPLRIVEGSTEIPPPVEAVAHLARQAHIDCQGSHWSVILPQYLRQPPIDTRILDSPPSPKPSSS